MPISKTAAYNRAKGEIARSWNDDSNNRTISLYDEKRKEWVRVGKMEKKASLKFERRYIERRMAELLQEAS